MSDPDSLQKGSHWRSLLTVLLDAGAKATDIYLVEVAPGGVWDFAFWNYDPDEIICTFHCPIGRGVWRPIETPCFTGAVRRWERPDGPRSKKPK